MMNDLILDFASDPDASAQLSELRLQQPRTLHGKQLRQLGPWRCLRRLRSERVGTCVALVTEFQLPGRWLGMLLLTLAVPAERRIALTRRGERLPLSWLSLLFRELPFVVRRACTTWSVRRRVKRELARLEPLDNARRFTPRSVLFCRPDLGPALTAGGSLAHIDGVVSGLLDHGCSVEMVSPAPIAGIEARGAGVTLVPAEERSALSVELPHLAYNATLIPRLKGLLDSSQAEMLYQRHALGCYAGAAAAGAAGIPLVLEYNGPEVWIARNWGSARRQLDLFLEAERRTLRAADLVVAVSAPLVDPLRKAGVPQERILVNPNGVDVRRFDPEANREARHRIREQLGVGPQTLVAGFVGTFGPWHGAEILAQAIARLPADLVEQACFVFIGDGPGRTSCEALVASAGRAERVVFTGLLPFSETPGWLAACDLCLSPHVPNADGTAFFGSPTKLFEYLASGHAVIASALGQIGEILEHDQTAWLVPPGDPDALAAAIVQLSRDAGLRARLGRAGRHLVRTEYTWNAHVERILARLAEASPASGRETR